MYEAEYFQYDNQTGVCSLLASSERDCSGMSGPRAGLAAGCLDGESTTATTTMTTTTHSNLGKYISHLFGYLTRLSLHIYSPALMVVGGYGARTDVSLFFPATNAACRGADLPDRREHHTAGESTGPTRPPSCVSSCRPLG